MSEMNRELKLRLMDYLEALEGAVSSTSDFVIEQAPMYVQEIVRWEIAEGIIWCIFFWAISWGFLVPNFTKLRSLRQEDNDTGWGLGFLAIVLMICSIAVASTWGCQSIKAYVAPRVVIIEHLTGAISPSVPLPAKK